MIPSILDCFSEIEPLLNYALTKLKKPASAGEDEKLLPFPETTGPGTMAEGHGSRHMTWVISANQCFNSQQGAMKIKERPSLSTLARAG